MKFKKFLMVSGLMLGVVGMAHADVTSSNLQSGLEGHPQQFKLQNDKGVTTKNNRIKSLEAKIESLEAQMKDLFQMGANNEKVIHPRPIPYDKESIQSMKEWSTEDHLSKAQEKMLYSEELQAKIQRLQNRIARFSDKPYLDTKGFKRSGLKRLLGNLERELREETAKVAWHNTRAQQAIVSKSQSQQVS